MHLNNIPAVLLALCSFAKAYEITFYAGDRCRSQRVGTIEVLAADGCQSGQPWNGISNSALITQTVEDLNFQVAFFEDDNCDLSRGVAVGNAGCLSVGELNRYGSFSVIGAERVALNSSDALDDTTSDHVPEIAERSEEVPKRVGTVQEIQHGDFSEFNGELWRWNQLAKGVYQGVRPDEWDNSLHIANYEPLEALESLSSDDATLEMSPNPADVLRMPDTVLEGFCSAINNCVQRAADATFGFPTNTRQVAGAIAGAKTAGTNILRFLERPVVMAFTFGVGGSIFTNWITAQFSGGDAPSDCAGAQEDSEVLTRLINLGVPATGPNVQAIRQSIRNGPRQSEGSLSVSYLPESTPNSGQFCGAPPRRSLALPMSRIKRDWLGTVPGFEEWLAVRVEAL